MLACFNFGYSICFLVWFVSSLLVPPLSYFKPNVLLSILLKLNYEKIAQAIGRLEKGREKCPKMWTMT